MILLFVALSPVAHAEQAISRGQLISGVVASNSYEMYTLSEQLPKACVFTIYFRVNEGTYGVVTLQRGTETVYQWTVGSGVIAALVPFPMYYTAFIARNDSYSLNVTSPGFGGSLNYTFFYDFSDQLQTNNSKSIPLEGGMASYYSDLESGNKVSLNLMSPPGSDFDIEVFFGYSYMMLSPPVASTVFTNSSKTLSFRAANEGRYFIFIAATTGGGAFNLQSSIVPQTPTYDELQSNYDQLNSSFQDLQAELASVRSVMYILAAITAISVIATVDLATRKPVVKAETKNP
jgi:hypothetical protein